MHLLKGFFIVNILIIVSSCVSGQSKIQKPQSIPKRRLIDFPELVFASIPGAPKLSAPKLITGNKQGVISQGHGLAAPAFWDWDGDGLKDLLIGEFASGVEYDRYVGNYIRVFKNVGTGEVPEFTGQWDYARPPFEYRAVNNGTPYSTDQFCCLGFTPQFVDLNQDNYPDMITGQYYGEVSWFPGDKKGFLPGRLLPQKGNIRASDWFTSEHQNYWLFSSASFGDFTGDKLPDLIIGGKDLRLSQNTGIAEKPQFSNRTVLLDEDGSPLKIYAYSELEFQKKKESFDLYGLKVPSSGDDKLMPYVVDWDGDNMLDLLVTNSYSHSGLSAVDFFKGVKIGNEYRFKKSVPLFVAKDDGKVFPGCALKVFVTDYNNDGISDLMIGTSVPLLAGKYNSRLAWNWEDDQELYGPGKDPANIRFNSEKDFTAYKNYTKPPSGFSMKEYFTIRHTGYVFVLLGN